MAAHVFEHGSFKATPLKRKYQYDHILIGENISVNFEQFLYKLIISSFLLMIYILVGFFNSIFEAYAKDVANNVQLLFNPFEQKILNDLR